MTHATTLQAAGNDIRQIAEQLDHRTESMAFTGPAAERFRTEMKNRTTRLRHAAQELQDVATIIGHADTNS